MARSCPLSEGLRQDALSGREVLARRLTRLYGVQRMLRAAIGNCLAFDPFALEEDALGPPKIDVSRREIVQALVIADMVVVLDEVRDLAFESARQVVMFEQDAVLERPVPALDLALGLRRRPPSKLAACGEVPTPRRTSQRAPCRRQAASYRPPGTPSTSHSTSTRRCLAAAELRDALLAPQALPIRMRILSSAEKCRRVARRRSLIASSAGCFSGPDFCLIFAPCGYDDPEILPS